MNSVRYLCAIVLSSLVSSFLPFAAYPQTAVNNRSRNVLFNDLPGFVHSQVRALGDRVSHPGKEITILDGRFRDPSNSESAVRMTFQLPQSLEISGLKPGTASLKFDSAIPPIPTDPDDSVLLETFVTDTAEGFLASIKDGREVEVIGYGIEDSETPSHIEFDVFEVHSPVKTRSDSLARTKVYYFDSATGLLMRTRYEDGRNEVEIRFSDWRRQEGSAYPGKIERYENNRLTFCYDILEITARPQSSTDR